MSVPPSKPRARQRISSGLAGLDAQLGGGIPDGTVILLVGEPMNAYELMGFHFASGGGTCVYIARDLTHQDVMEGVERVGGSSKNLLLLGADDPLPVLETGQRAVVEAFAEFAADKEWLDVKAWVMDLRKQCAESGATVLLMATRGMLDPAYEVQLQQLCDGAMELGFDRQGFALYPYLKVTKMRGVPDANRFLLFKETPKGLFMENTRRVF